MNTSFVQDRTAVRARPPASPLYFPADEPKLFAWLHEPANAATAELGLVICKPFGYEAICAHRSLRAFADMSAAAGVPALRFDYSSTGDSADFDGEGNRIEQWRDDIISAVEELRRRTRVSRVCLLGFRLGAMLATVAAGCCDCVDSLILVAPVTSGRRYAGEMRTTAMAAALRLKSATTSNTTAPTATEADGSIEVSGHVVSAATLGRLAQQQLENGPGPAVTRILIIDRDDLPAAQKWAESLASGVDAEYAVLPGFVKMMMTPPQYSSIPEQMLERMRAWLSRTAVCRGTAADHHSAARPISPPTVLLIRHEEQAAEGPLTERPVRFGSDADLFGIVTEPREGENRRRAVILVNAGADYHIAIGRMYVSLARHWAGSGYTVLRMDLAGLGDSSTRPNRPDNEVFPPAATEDIRAATAFMRDQYGARDLTVAGLCSGAYHALQAAADAVPLNRILLVNPETFWWQEGTTLDEIHTAAVIKTSRVYGQRLRSWEHWKKLLTGRADVAWIARRFLKRFTMALTVGGRALLRHLNIRLRNDLGWKLEQIAARGVQTTMVFSREEPGIELLRMQAGSATLGLGDRFRMHIIDGADHTFSHSASRAVLQQILSDELSKRAGVA